MVNRIISALWLIFTATTSMVLFFIALFIWAVTLPFDRKKKILHIFTCAWASLYSFIMPAWRVNITGKEKIRKDATYVVVSNHQSHLDVLMVFRLFFHFKWVSKIEIFRVPFIGWNMVLNRYVKLIRGDKQSIMQMLKDAEKHLKEGSSVYFFPEGTRSQDGSIKKFKPGAFDLALKQKVPILPIAISGTFEALPKYSMNFHGVQNILIRIMDEVPYEKFKDKNAEETAAMIQELIAENVKELDSIRKKEA